MDTEGVDVNLKDRPCVSGNAMTGNAVTTRITAPADKQERIATATRFSECTLVNI
jgi:hypothetical protein